MTGRRIHGLTSLHVESGVNEVGHGFITIRAEGETLTGEPIVMVGQLDVATARTQGLAFFEAAEAAETDASLFRFAHAVDPDGEPGEVMAKAGALIAAVREHRP